jgi:hypothetical protein
LKTKVDGRLVHEASRFVLRFTCEDCAHASTADETSCSFGYPPAPRRGALDKTELEFCKEFELG